MLLKGFFRTQSTNPILPPDEWSLVQQITTPGAYSTTLGWGRYKIELSGGGGSGGAASSAHSSAYNYANNGDSGKLFITTIDVAFDETRTLTGIVGAGGNPSTARGYDNQSGSYSLGSGGSGYTSGGSGTGQVKNSIKAGGQITSAAAAGGAGGGSTSADGLGRAAGGAGGSCRAENSSQQRATGTGGGPGSGSNQGGGASGGAGKFGYDALATSGVGSNGWVKIYKSNVYPEPI